jgi:hypothetical protein
VEATGAGIDDADRDVARAAGGAAEVVVERLHADLLGHPRAIEGAAMAAGVAPDEDGKGVGGRYARTGFPSAALPNDTPGDLSSLQGSDHLREVDLALGVFGLELGRPAACLTVEAVKKLDFFTTTLSLSY